MARSLRLAFEGDTFVLEAPWSVPASYDLANRLWNRNPVAGEKAELPAGTELRIINMHSRDQVALRAAIGRFKPAFTVTQADLEAAVFKD